MHRKNRHFTLRHISQFLPIDVNLEMLGEQRAVIDHGGEKLRRDFMVQEAQNTLRALQREREMAERIEQGIKALRVRSESGVGESLGGTDVPPFLYGATYCWVLAVERRGA